MKQALLVLGMHRSGTSSLAGALAHLGAAAPATLMPEHPDNPKGYWESLPLVHANDRILQSAGSSWNDWRPFNPDWRKSVTGKAMTGALPDLIAAEFGAQPLITIKDPRLCRLFPIWEHALINSGYQPLVLTPLRSPIEVAASLSKRDGFSQSRGLLLWLRHALEAEATTRHTPRHFLYWSDFLNDWRAELTRATERLGATLPGWSDFTAEAVDGFLDVQLRRAVHDREMPSHAPEWIKAAWEALGELQQNPIATGAQDTLDDIRKEFDSTARIYGPVLAGLEGERLNWNTDIQAQVAALTSELAVAHHARDNESASRAETEAVLQTYMAKANEAEQQRDALQLDLELAVNAQRHAELDLANFEIQLSNHDQELRAQLATAAAREIHLQSEVEARNALKDQLRQNLLEERTSTSETIAGLERELEILRQTEAARLAPNPLRRWIKTNLVAR